MMPNDSASLPPVFIPPPGSSPPDGVPRKRKVFSNLQQLYRNNLPFVSPLSVFSLILLLRTGFNILTLDEGWSQTHDRKNILIDQYGRPVPNPDLYPSSQGGAGMKPIADRLHAMGLKLGLWILRGIPVTAIEAKSEILGGGGVTADKVRRRRRPAEEEGTTNRSQ